MHYLIRIAFLALMGLTLSACSTAHKTGDLDGESADLAIPPTLDLPISTGIMDLPAIKEGMRANASDCVLPTTLPTGTLNYNHDGGERWLSTSIPGDVLWGYIEEFWDKRDFDLRYNEPHLGIIETYWKTSEDDRFAKPVQNKFRLRMESPKSGQTELYLTHYGVIANGNNEWKSRGQDIDMEVEYLQRLALFLGHSIEPTSTKKDNSSKYRIVGTKLIVPQNFERSWRIVGTALDRMGAVISDRDRTKGTLFITHIEAIDDGDDSGWFSRLFGAAEPKVKQNLEFQVNVKTSDEITEVSIDGDIDNKDKNTLLEAIRDQL